MRTKNRSAELDPEQILEQLTSHFPRPDRYWVGFSGGLDSSVLLHVLAGLRERLPAPLSAIHVDHDLQSDSAAWAMHCRGECERLGIELFSCKVDAAAGPGESPEAAARDARYRAIAGILRPDAMLLTAHHRDDQAETLLLQLLRGAGVEGLAAMPAVRKWHRGWHVRPLLGVSRRAIHDWALEQGVGWVDDPSNRMVDADRNYLRHQVLPGLLARWPGALEGIGRSAAHCADAAELIRDVADRDLASVHCDGRLLIAGLKALSPVRARNLVRHWLRVHDAPPLSSRRLHDVLEQLCHARPDAAVRIAWHGVELRRYRDQAWLLSEQAEPPSPVSRDWVGEEVWLGPGLGRVRRHLGAGGIDPERWAQGRARIVYRDTAFSCRPAGRAGSRSFKKLAQEFGIPPWLRSIVPILTLDDQPAAVAGFCICEPFAVPHDNQGWLVEWIPDSPSSPQESRS